MSLFLPLSFPSHRITDWSNKNNRDLEIKLKRCRYFWGKTFLPNTRSTDQAWGVEVEHKKLGWLRLKLFFVRFICWENLWIIYVEEINQLQIIIIIMDFECWCWWKKLLCYQSICLLHLCSHIWNLI